MEKLVSNFSFQSFKPFVTRNIRRDGEPVEVTSKSCLGRLCRENHVIPSPVNDTPEGRADPREFLSSKRKRAHPARICKATLDEFDPTARRAVDTQFGATGN